MSLDRAIADVKRFTQNGFSREITFNNGTNTAIVRGLVSKHNLSINPDTGMPMNSRNAHLSVSESNLVDESYPTRDSNDEISLKDNTVSWIDASGVSYDYKIDEVMPSNTVGWIVCLLGELE